MGLVRIPHWAAASEYRSGTRELLGGKWSLKQSDLGMTIEAVSREAFEAQLKSVRVLAFGEREGVFGPASVIWRVVREAAFLGAGRALLLQLAHPWVAAASRNTLERSTIPSVGLIGPSGWYLAWYSGRSTKLLPRPGVYTDATLQFGPNAAELNRRAASYVDKVLKGAKPADLPMQQPAAFELAINLKTAKALGLTAPPSLLARADELIE